MCSEKHEGIRVRLHSLHWTKTNCSANGSKPNIFMSSLVSFWTIDSGAVPFAQGLSPSSDFDDVLGRAGASLTVKKLMNTYTECNAESSGMLDQVRPSFFCKLLAILCFEIAANKLSKIVIARCFVVKWMLVCCLFRQSSSQPSLPSSCFQWDSEHTGSFFEIDKYFFNSLHPETEQVTFCG
jgi:hypothetical protein